MNGPAVLGLLLLGFLAGVATVLAVSRPSVPESFDGYVSWLRHPAHRNRCACREYGLPEHGMVVRDDLADHRATHCTPDRERLED